MLKRYQISYLLFCMVWLVVGCQSESPNPAPPPDKDTAAVVGPIQTATEGLMLVVATHVAIVREAPDISAKEIARLRHGDSLLFGNQVSNHTLAMRLEGVQYDEPWLRVLLPAEPNQQSRSGWVYGASLQFVNLQDVQLRELVVDRRIRSALGEKWLNPLLSYRRQMQQIQTATAFESSWQRSLQLRDSLESILNAIAQQQLRQRDSLPDFFWLNDVLDNSMLVHWVGEQQKYYLFHDLRYWLAKSLMTVEDADDDFIRLQLAANPSDSIGSWLPSGQLYDEGTTISLLGSMLHYRLLDSIAAQTSRDSLFITHNLMTKQFIINDIVNTNAYWYPDSQAQEEIDSILTLPLWLISRADRISLQARRNQLAEPNIHNIQLNKGDMESL